MREPDQASSDGPRWSTARFPPASKDGHSLVRCACPVTPDSRHCSSTRQRTPRSPRAPPSQDRCPPTRIKLRNARLGVERQPPFLRERSRLIFGEGFEFV